MMVFVRLYILFLVWFLTCHQSVYDNELVMSYPIKAMDVQNFRLGPIQTETISGETAQVFNRLALSSTRSRSCTSVSASETATFWNRLPEWINLKTPSSRLRLDSWATSFLNRWRRSLHLARLVPPLTARADTLFIYLIIFRVRAFTVARRQRP